MGDSELGELVEWLIQQIANLSMRKRCVGSIPTLSAKLVSRLEKFGLSRLAHNQKITGSNPVPATKSVFSVLRVQVSQEAQNNAGVAEWSRHQI